MGCIEESMSKVMSDSGNWCHRKISILRCWGLGASRELRFVVWGGKIGVRPRECI